MKNTQTFIPAHSSGLLGTATVNYAQTGTGNSTARGVGLTGNTVRNIASDAAMLVFSTGGIFVNGLLALGNVLFQCG